MSSTRSLNQILHVTGELALASSAEKRLKNLDIISDFDRRDIQRWSQPSPIMAERTIHDINKQKVLVIPHANAVHVCILGG